MTQLYCQGCQWLCSSSCGRYVCQPVWGGYSDTSICARHGDDTPNLTTSARHKGPLLSRFSLLRCFQRLESGEVVSIMVPVELETAFLTTTHHTKRSIRHLNAIELHYV
jgi:hypothetical protein